MPPPLPFLLVCLAISFIFERALRPHLFEHKELIPAFDLFYVVLVCLGAFANFVAWILIARQERKTGFRYRTFFGVACYQTGFLSVVYALGFSLAYGVLKIFDPDGFRVLICDGSQQMIERQVWSIGVVSNVLLMLSMFIAMGYWYVCSWRGYALAFNATALQSLFAFWLSAILLVFLFIPYAMLISFPANLGEVGPIKEQVCQV